MSDDKCATCGRRIFLERGGAFWVHQGEEDNSHVARPKDDTDTPEPNDPGMPDMTSFGAGYEGNLRDATDAEKRDYLRKASEPNAEALKECPFCGGEEIIFINKYGEFRAHCCHCRICGPKGNRVEATKLWNTRPDANPWRPASEPPTKRMVGMQISDMVIAFLADGRRCFANYCLRDGIWIKHDQSKPPVTHWKHTGPPPEPEDAGETGEGA